MIKDEELKQKSIMHNPPDFSGKVALVTGAPQQGWDWPRQTRSPRLERL